MPRKRVIIVLNTGGTGTHLIQSIFFRHPEIVPVKLPNFWGAAALYLTKPEATNHWGDRDESLREKNNREYFLSIVDRYGRGAAGDARGLITDTWDAFVESHSGVVFDKSMTYMSHHNDWGGEEIAATHDLLIDYYKHCKSHDVKFLILVREPLDHIASLFERNVFSRTGNTSIAGFEAMDYPHKLKSLVVQYHRNIDSFVGRRAGRIIWSSSMKTCAFSRRGRFESFLTISRLWPQPISKTLFTITRWPSGWIPGKHGSSRGIPKY